MSIRDIRSATHNKFKTVTVTTYTVLNEEIILADSTSNAITLTLPASLSTGGRRTVLVVDSTGQAGTNNVTVARASTDTINGGTSFVITQNYAQVLFVDNGDGTWAATPVGTITASSAEINARVTGQPTTATIAAAAGAANICLVTITVKDGTGTAVTGPVVMDVLLSDAATGAGLTATTASGAVAAGASGTDLATLVSKKALKVQTTAAGVYILSITDTSKTGFYPVVHIPGLKAVVGDQLVTGDYG